MEQTYELYIDFSRADHSFCALSHMINESLFLFLMHLFIFMKGMHIYYVYTFY